MGWFNQHVIGALSPRWAFARERYARALQAYYEVTEPSRTRKSRTGGTSADVVNHRSGVKLRDLARHLEENLDIASGILDVLVSNSVGPGIMPEPLVETKGGEPAEAFNAALLKLYDLWLYECEVTRQFDKYSLERVIARSWFRDGECFGQKLIGGVAGVKHGTVLPYSLQAFEADYIPYDYDDAPKGIRQGIELDKWGKPLRYYAYQAHPGDTLLHNKNDLVTLDAERVLHLKMVKRLHQTRGVTVFAPALGRLDDIKEIDETERVAARVAATMAAFIKKGTPELYTSQTLNGGSTPREMSLEPGIVFDNLQPGEDVGTIASNRPNNALIPFRDAQLRSAAAGVMASYSSVSKNYNGTYSAQRQELVEQFATYRALSTHFIYRWSQPVWDGFIDAVVASGALTIDSTIDRSTLYNVSHMGPPMPWIDPLQEVEAAILAEENIYESKSTIIRRRGGNPDQVYRETQRDRQQLEKRGLKERGGSAPSSAADPAQEQAIARAVVNVMNTRPAEKSNATHVHFGAGAFKAEVTQAAINPNVIINVPETPAPVVNVDVKPTAPTPVEVHSHVTNEVKNELPTYEIVEQQHLRDAKGVLSKTITTKKRVDAR